MYKYLNESGLVPYRVKVNHYQSTINMADMVLVNDFSPSIKRNICLNLRKSDYIPIRPIRKTKSVDMIVCAVYCDW